MDQILAAIEPPYIHIRIIGRGTFQNAPQIKAFIDSTLTSTLSTIILDLQACTYLDSTFLGTLTGIAIKLKQQHYPPLTLIHTSGRNLELIRNLCLDKLFNLPPSPAPSPTEQLKPLIPAPSLDKASTCTAMIEAHENLIQWHPPNANKFQDVLHYLRTRTSPPPSS